MFLPTKKTLCALAFCSMAATHASEEQIKPSLAQVWAKGAFDFGTGFASGAATAVVGAKILKEAHFIYPHAAFVLAFGTPAALPVALVTGRGVFITLDKAGEVVGITHYDQEASPFPQEDRYAVRSVGFLVGAFAGSYYSSPALKGSIETIVGKIRHHFAASNEDK